jgi:pimeloyl-ACP methyl ester carboxylesterase
MARRRIDNPDRKYRWNGPDELERYLEIHERKWSDDLGSGVAKKIVWRNPDRRPTKLAVIYMHGFSASRRELAPIPENLAMLLDANLFYTRLTGHGLPGHLLAAATLDDWLADAQEALAIGRAIGQKVLLMGMSTGAALSVWLAARSPAQIGALVLISPNFGLRSTPARLLTYPWGRWLLSPLAGLARSWPPLNSRQGLYWTTRYPIRALYPLGELIAMVRTLNPVHIPQPVMMILSNLDRIINVRLAKKTFIQFSNPKNHLFQFGESQDPKHHILGGDIVSPAGNNIIIEQVLYFIEKLSE